ncbi:MAG: malonyl-ACP O-methyltransferase BioC [Methylomicrobium sp.]
MSQTFELDKTRLRQSFGAASASYDSVAALQRTAGAILLRHLTAFELTGSVLDLGCGTGFVAKHLLEIDSLGRVVALDIALPMLQAARHKLAASSKLAFVAADAERLPFGNISFDAIVSNFALQWCRDLEALFADFRRVLKPGGKLVFSTFGPQTLSELKRAWAVVDDYRHVNEFYPPQEIIRCLQVAGFHDVVEHSEIFRPTYPTVLDLMKELKTMGAHNVAIGRNKKMTTKKQLERMIHAYPLVGRGDRIVATFQVLIFSARTTS